MEFTFIEFWYLTDTLIYSSLQQATHRDRQTDSQTGQRGRRGEETITGRQSVLYFFCLTQIMAYAELFIRRSLIVIACPLVGINLHYFFIPFPPLKRNMWEVFALLNLWHSGFQNNETDADIRDIFRTQTKERQCSHTAPPHLQKQHCSWQAVTLQIPAEVIL